MVNRVASAFNPFRVFRVLRVPNSEAVLELDTENTEDTVKTKEID